jgi:hypothetical protein
MIHDGDSERPDMVKDAVDRLNSARYMEKLIKIKNLAAKYPNDAEFGLQVRLLFTENIS